MFSFHADFPRPKMLPGASKNYRTQKNLWRILLLHRAKLDIAIRKGTQERKANTERGIVIDERGSNVAGTIPFAPPYTS